MLVVFSALMGGFVRLGPLPASVAAPTVTPAIVDRFGIPLDRASMRSLAVASSAGRRRSNADGDSTRLSLSRRAWRLAAATVAAEDERFNDHIGVDPIALGRAAIADVRARRIVQGASTVTQQLVKIRRAARTGGNRGPMEKAREALYAVRLEHRYSKDELLSSYLAEAPYGGSVVGADLAAKAYFDAEVSQLSWAQAAYLAAIPQRPTRFDPRRDANAALKRQRWILGRLRDAHAITSVEAREALAEKIDITPGFSVAMAPHFTRALRDGSLCTIATCADDVGAASVVTTLDGALQQDVAGIAAHQRKMLAKYGAANVAVVVLDNATGAIRAYEGSGGWVGAVAANRGGMIDGVRQPRQTGSVIKAFVYALAFDEGANPGDFVDDAPFVASGAGREFRPQNYDRRFRGELTMREALAQSVNVPAVRVLAEHGPDDLAVLLGRAGVALPPSTYGLSMALGAAEVDLLHLTAAYATFARGGRSLTPVAVEPVGRPGAAQQGRRVVSPEAAFLVTDVLADNNARMPAFGRSSALRFDFPVSAKTGTSSDFHDNWVVGSSARVTVGVWVGNFDRTPLRNASGVTGAGPVFRSVMLAAEERLSRDPFAGPLLRAPDTLAQLPLCQRSACLTKVDDWIRADRTGGEFIEGQAPIGIVQPSVSPAAVRPTPTKPSWQDLTVVSPSSRGAYVIDPSRTVGQLLPLRASGGKPPYAFTIDGTEADSSGWFPIEGTHKICAQDKLGRSACHEFQVRRVP